MYIIYETENQSAINIEGLHRYLVLLTLDYSTTVGGGVHEQAVKTKPVTISRKPWKNPMELDLIMNTDVSTLMRSKKKNLFLRIPSRYRSFHRNTLSTLPWRQQVSFSSFLRCIPEKIQ